MIITNRQPKETANISSARGTAGKELWQLVLSALALLIILYFVIGIAVNLVVSRISVETEAKIFNNFKAAAAKNPDASSRKQLERASAILAKLQTGKNVPPLPYRIVFIDHEKPNAFAFPGGTIGVTKGLMDVLDDEIEVAFVLGHELGHFYHRDHLQGMGRAIGFKIVMAVVFGSGSGAEFLGQSFDFVFERKYSREREKKADRFGIELVYAAYGKVEGVDRLFRILLDNDTIPDWAYMFSTHPSSRERIDDLKSYAAALQK
ncbi:MAG: M48 family metallopeptidase [Deltaproteobacteria bacterium]|nr:M48 family metallopeptidase [Deltaproteobacteria bacterium]